MSREDDVRVTVGGVITTATVVRQALATLQAAPGLGETQPLRDRPTRSTSPAGRSPASSRWADKWG